MNVFPFLMLIAFALCDTHKTKHVKVVSSGAVLHGDLHQVMVIKTKEKVHGHAHVHYQTSGDHHNGGHYHVKYHEHNYPGHYKFYYKAHGYSHQ